ncbi:MAG: hypothetical protein M1458_00260 [Deltaproteobacteria bacterium]|nr:hypothetical protein [Deltaproteobacteria bacterium]
MKKAKDKIACEVTKMDHIWDYEEIKRITKSKKPDFVRTGLYPFDKKGIEMEAPLKLLF